MKNLTPDVIASPEAAVVAPAIPAAGTVKMVRDAMRHEQEGALEVSLRAYVKAAAGLHNGNPGRAALEAKIAELQRKVCLNGLTELDINENTSPSAVLHSALKKSAKKSFGSQDEEAAAEPQPVAAEEQEENEPSVADEDYYEQPLQEPQQTAQVRDWSTAALMDVPAVNREVKNLLERQVVDILNNGTVTQLMTLHGIGAKRAQYIVGTAGCAATCPACPLWCPKGTKHSNTFHCSHVSPLLPPYPLLQNTARSLPTKAASRR